MSEPKRNGEIEAPVWVAMVTYLICWPLGAWAVYYGVTHMARDAMILGLVLVVFPVAGFKPLDLLLRLLGR